MSIFDLPPVDAIVRHVSEGLREARRVEMPYRRWLATEVLPEKIAAGILMLPIAPPMVGDCQGVRDRHNDKRSFFTPGLQARFPVCARLAEGFQDARAAAAFRDLCGTEAEGSYLRMEYIQDLDGAWLEPHRDIPEKLFSMVIYLCTGPEAEHWGTDIYDDDRRWIGRSRADFNTAVIFVAGPNTWHGFEKRPIAGVRRLMEINYVRPSWRDRDQLSFPDRPISLSR